jgi:guanosine-3',5'-bis(diphosphate) 3'-pyrophosphohydrolase
MDNQKLKNDLIEKVQSYNSDVDIDLIGKSVDFARKYHEGQIRKNGDPYYTHPIEVASLLADIRLDEASIITAVLHDTVEDTDATLDDIEKQFGKEVATLVDGVTKLNQIESKTVEGKQAENFRKLVLAMSEDIRVLLVKLGDRLHNMRTLHHFKDRVDKQRRIARETIEIYAPLAERIGIHKIKEELEDLSFSFLYPEARESIMKRLSFLREEETGLVDTIIKTLDKQAKEAKINTKVSGREKTRYSIWKKMQRKNVAFEQLSDIMAFRIIVDDIGECYHMLGVIHSHYPTVPGRFKDYISTPKSNGYKSIHTTVIGPENQRVEIQIRTKEMHEEADLGVAAHWAYKQGKPGNNKGDLKKFRWLRELLEILEQDSHAEDFLENTKLELFTEQVFCFTPKGDLIELPAGASCVDFAYAIHSDVGNKCVGSKINGRIAPLSTKLNNGDQVSIQTSKNQSPSPTWERFAITGKAKSHIRRYIRQQQRDQYMELGRAMVVKVFKQEGFDFAEKMLSGLTGKFKVDAIEDVITGVGQGNIVARDVFKAVFPDHKSDQQQSQDDFINNKIPSVEQFNKAKKINKNAPMPIKGLIPGMAVHFARCCHPLPGDRIVGIVATGRGVTVHTMDCDTLENFADTPERWLDVSWGEGKDAPETHVGRINMTISNEAGALGTLSNIVTTNEGNITNLKITNRSLDFWDMYIDVYVEDVSHLANIVAALRASPEITDVERAKGK